MTISKSQKFAAELRGTFFLTLGGWGGAVLAYVFPSSDIGLLGLSIAFGLMVVAGIYGFGLISGGHFNPAGSIALAVTRRIPPGELPGYIVSQALYAICGASVLLLLTVSQKIDFVGAGGFASNGYGDSSPGGFDLASMLACEVVTTAFFLLVILGAAAKRVGSGFVGLGFRAYSLDFYSGIEYACEFCEECRPCIVCAKQCARRSPASLDRAYCGRSCGNVGLQLSFFRSRVSQFACGLVSSMPHINRSRIGGPLLRRCFNFGVLFLLGQRTKILGSGAMPSPGLLGKTQPLNF